MATEKQRRNELAKKMFGKSWRQLDGFLRHAVTLVLRSKSHRAESVAAQKGGA